MSHQHRGVPWLTPRRFYGLLVVGLFSAGFAYGWFVADQRATTGLAIAIAIVAPLAVVATISDRVLLDERHERIAERAGAYTVLVVGGLGVLGMVGVGLGEQFGYVEIAPQMVGFGLGIAVLGSVNVVLQTVLRYRT